MPIIPIRGLSAQGVVSDVDPASLPTTAWSDGNNIWVEDGKVRRAPINREVSTTAQQPWSVFSRTPATGQDLLQYQTPTGSVFELVGGTWVDVSVAGSSPTALTLQTTTTQLGDVAYINNPAQQPAFFGPSSSAYQLLPGWDPTWRCQSLRAFGDYLVALNVTKGATETAQMVKWSDLTLAGLPPASWNADDPTTSAGENILETLTSPIVDGLSLRNLFIIYSQTQIVAMVQSGDNEIFDFQVIYTEGGLLAPNCAVEVQGVHYVFGVNDIYRHDGTGSGRQSLVDGLNRKRIFRELDRTKATSAFVAYMPNFRKVLFCYAANTPDATWPALAGYCNRAFVFDLPSSSHSFMDLPNVSSYSLANLVDALGATWASSTGSWTTTGGSWFDSEFSFSRTPIFNSVVGGGVLTNRLVAPDFMNLGSLPLLYQPDCNAVNVFIRRDYLDLDQMGDVVETYKSVRRLFPIAVTYEPVPINISWGGSLYPAGPINLSAPLAFDASSDYKVDTRIGGRYLSILFQLPSSSDFSLTGFDADVDNLGAR